ncbi:hypothetical protein MOV66_06100 [Agrobacterium sp. SHOUNA12C]|uniref:hypothetical protein n=1 Tax=Rhizobium rhizogenes TaxID=359 RepID=UPI001238A895|nr:hypothetical protein [Rhizobium rhizogenes]MCJ9721230.1 hypothetical protein [Agrobacterium sp. BETTINA12B]MCJ9756209.1 hypothetical protein [Agrobacterium sp. SHOUNA12C]NTF52273.1 hypothetical protein [Rhizobium rhizogenes]NTG17817.1 hypothetical protein [Rhizobium rhizogenes]NTG24477.1 hypothetical protein [Rhizobium rhizogenes]
MSGTNYNHACVHIRTGGWRPAQPSDDNIQPAQPRYATRQKNRILPWPRSHWRMHAPISRGLQQTGHVQQHFRNVSEKICISHPIRVRAERQATISAMHDENQ